MPLELRVFQMYEFCPVLFLHSLDCLRQVADFVFQMVGQQHHVAPEGAVQLAAPEHAPETVHRALYPDSEYRTDKILVRHFKEVESEKSFELAEVTPASTTVIMSFPTGMSRRP